MQSRVNPAKGALGGRSRGASLSSAFRSRAGVEAIARFVLAADMRVLAAGVELR
jgi:hypothetical protein